MLQANEIGVSLLTAIEKYQVLSSIGNTSTNSRNNHVTWPNSIQVFATNLLHLTRVEQLVKRFKK